MASLRARSVLLAAALVAGTALLTACQSDTGDKASSDVTATASSTKAAAGAEDSSGADSNADASASSGTKAPAAESASDGTDEAGSGPTSASTDDEAGQGKEGKGVSGTWFGNVSYLAPGKYTVSGPKSEEQAFFTSDDTEIWGAGDICGDENGQSATKCTEQELEAAAKKGVSAEVKISNGIATRITDDH
uniref:Lipoprotein n=1 Tax=Streptomyces sp. NBC_00008 TaxID=2903610 RepID=A0AAU2VUF3_9ACTN